MKKFSLLFAIFIIGSSVFAQEDPDGSTLGQPVRPPVETPWKQLDIGTFSQPVPYSHQRQNDVMYYITIWRTIDLREKMNHPLYFPVEQRGTWRSLAQVILDAIDINNPDNPDALPVYTTEFCDVRQDRENLMAAMVTTTTMDIIDPETGEVIGSQDIISEHRSSEILSYRLKEVWFFDKQRSVMEVRILEIEPIIEYVRETNAFAEEDEELVTGVTSMKRLGYIMYDELRPYLVQQEVFNVKNNAQRLSLDDVLTFKRQFNSYIYAEDNVYGQRYINEYIANPRDQRIESERITNEIRVFEHDLWEF